MIRLTKILTLLVVLSVLASCGGGGGGSTISPVIAPTSPPPPEPISINGSVLDGPVVGGTIFIFSRNDINQVLDDAAQADDRTASLMAASPIATLVRTEAEGSDYEISISDMATEAVFVVFDNAGSRDETFGDVPFNLESVAVLGSAGSSQTINLTPHTSLIAVQVRAALDPDGDGSAIDNDQVDAEIQVATDAVIAAFGNDEFGEEILEAGTDIIGSEDEELLEDASKVVAMLVRFSASITGDTREEVLETLALDALDGSLDGSIPAGADVDDEQLELLADLREMQTLGEFDEDSIVIGSCASTVTLLRAACEIDVFDDFLEGKAVCQGQDITDMDEVMECIAELDEGMEEELEECADVNDAREELCEDVDDAVHDPEFGEEYADNFVDPRDIGDDVAVNPFFPLVYGNVWVYEVSGVDEDGEEVEETITVTVTNKVKLIEGIECLVVNDIVVDDDGLVLEDTDDWFAQDVDGNIWYCGEISKNYELFEGDEPEEPELVELEGSWKSGREFGKAGILIPAEPQVGDVIRQEVAFGEAEDVVEILNLAGTESSPVASCVDTCLITKDFSPLEPDAEENKFYIPGFGLIVESNPETSERVELVSFTNIAEGPVLVEAKLLIEHNSTDEDTGFQGFADGDPWDQLIITGPGDVDIATFTSGGGLAEFGLTELFFETAEPENAEVPIDDVLDRLPEGTYTFTGDIVDGDESTVTAVLSHDIPAGPVLLTPEDGAEGVDPNNTIVSWELVTADIDGDEIDIVGYQAIVEELVSAEFPSGFAKPVFSVYLDAITTQVTVPVGFLKDDACYEFEVLAIEDSGNQTLASGEFETGEGCEPEEEEETEGLTAAKILIEHNSTDEDTGFQGFIDGDAYNRVTITDPDNVDIVTITSEGGLFDFGLAELFFETSEPENADVPIDDVLDRLPEGTYTFTADIVDGEESTLTATLSHDIPMGPVLTSPENEAEDVDPDNTVVSWEPVTTDLDGDPITIVGYQVIVEEDSDAEFPSGFAQPVFSIYLPASATSVMVPAEFMKSETEYEFEVLAIEESGNQTLSSAEFETE